MQDEGLWTVSCLFYEKYGWWLLAFRVLYIGVYLVIGNKNDHKSSIVSYSLVSSSSSRLFGHEGQIFIPSYGALLAKQQQQKMTCKWSTHYHLLKNTELMPNMWTTKSSLIYGMQQAANWKDESNIWWINAHFLL